MRNLLPAFLSLSLVTSTALADPGLTRNAIPQRNQQTGKGNPTNTRQVNNENAIIAQEKTYGTFTLTVSHIANDQTIPDLYAYCAPNGSGGTQDSQNISPAIQWSPPPANTQSLVFLVVDRDVPANFDKANIPGTTIDVKAPRQNFYHWVLVDIPPNVNGILQGKDSDGIIAGGKPLGTTQGYGINGQNDYSKMSPGPHGGYDGPCPPWNDMRMHHYHFIAYALDIPSLKLPNPVKGAQVEVAIKGHILAQSEVVGTYSTNPSWLKTAVPSLPKE